MNDEIHLRYLASLVPVFQVITVLHPFPLGQAIAQLCNLDKITASFFFTLCFIFSALFLIQ